MTEASREERTLAVALHVADILSAHGVKAAFVGAAALAVHGYRRATEDLDLGIPVASLAELRSLADALRAALPEARVELRPPDADDALGGVIDVETDNEDLVQVINFINPIGMGDHPGREAVLRARLIDAGTAQVGVIPLDYLVAVKLHAGWLKDKADVVALLAANPPDAIERARVVCAKYRLEGELDSLLPEIEAERADD